MSDQLVFDLDAEARRILGVDKPLSASACRREVTVNGQTYVFDEPQPDGGNYMLEGTARFSGYMLESFDTATSSINDPPPDYAALAWGQFALESAAFVDDSGAVGLLVQNLSVHSDGPGSRCTAGRIIGPTAVWNAFFDRHLAPHDLPVRLTPGGPVAFTLTNARVGTLGIAAGAEGMRVIENVMFGYDRVVNGATIVVGDRRLAVGFTGRQTTGPAVGHTAGLAHVGFGAIAGTDGYGYGTDNDGTAGVGPIRFRRLNVQFDTGYGHGRLEDVTLPEAGADAFLARFGDVTNAGINNLWFTWPGATAREFRHVVVAAYNGPAVSIDGLRHLQYLDFHCVEAVENPYGNPPGAGVAVLDSRRVL